MRRFFQLVPAILLLFVLPPVVGQQAPLRQGVPRPAQALPSSM